MLSFWLILARSGTVFLADPCLSINVLAVGLGIRFVGKTIFSKRSNRLISDIGYLLVNARPSLEQMPKLG